MTRLGTAASLGTRALARITLIVLAASAMRAAVLLWLWPPAAEREYHLKREIARFTPTLGHGAIQFGGETLLLILVARVARRRLRIRL